MDTIDESVNPCHDFYQFSCGKWIDNKQIPEDRPAVNQFSELSDKLNKQLKGLIQNINLKTESRPFIRNIKHFYDSCLNTSLLEQLGNKPLDDLIAKLGGWPVVSGSYWSNIQWTDVYLRLHDVGVINSMLFSLDIQIDDKNNSRRILTIDRSSFGLMSRDAMLKGDNDKSIKAYKTLITKTMEKLGVNQQVVEPYVEKLFAFELQLANVLEIFLVDYILWRVVQSKLSYLDESWYQLIEKFWFVITGQKRRPPRWETLEEALNKLDKLKVMVGYPDQLMDEPKVADYYQTLSINNSDNYFGNVNHLHKWYLDLDFAKLNKPVNLWDWRDMASVVVVNAFYSPERSRVLMMAGILQGVFYNKDRPNYMNYGAIGHVFGHEITHGFDDEGRQYDSSGNLRNWWDTDTDARYKKKADCFVQQYSNFTVNEISKKLNGIHTQGENIADNGGIIQSYRAYEKYVADWGPEPRLPALNYTPEQLFWISSGVQWCSKSTNEFLLNIMLNDAHSPCRQRVNGFVSNSVDFSKVFNCPLGSPMNPLNKCKIW
ncbi:neprilysin-2-like [Oppia nitens]|uniref:neprilysin-2-like n=1 Tax=Oppia nitens TaxID=1686743 RepID=UPI0023DB760D|nr:neprilysin-2-like [Oppia nitens]